MCWLVQGSTPGSRVPWTGSACSTPCQRPWRESTAPSAARWGVALLAAAHAGSQLVQAPHTEIDKHAMIPDSCEHVCMPVPAHASVRVQVAGGTDGRCTSAMRVDVDSVDLLAVVCAADEPGTQAALEHIIQVDPASQGVALYQVRAACSRPAAEVHHDIESVNSSPIAMSAC